MQPSLPSCWEDFRRNVRHSWHRLGKLKPLSLNQLCCFSSNLNDWWQWRHLRSREPSHKRFCTMAGVDAEAVLGRCTGSCTHFGSNEIPPAPTRTVGAGHVTAGLTWGNGQLGSVQFFFWQDFLIGWRLPIVFTSLQKQSSNNELFYWISSVLYMSYGSAFPACA